MKTQSQASNIAAADSKVFGMLASFRKLENMLPPQVQNAQFSDDHCSFEVAGIAKVNLKIAERIENRRLVYAVENDKNLPASAQIDITPIDANHCALKLELDLGLPIFLQGMVKGPLQKGADVAVQKIKEAAEQNNQ